MIPAALLRRFYVESSLRNVSDGIEFQLKNTVAPATLVSLGPIEVNGVPFAPNEVTVTASKPRLASTINERAPLALGMGKQIDLHVSSGELGPGAHEVLVHAVTREVGAVVIEITETL